jgi:hypothetical protein
MGRKRSDQGSHLAALAKEPTPWRMEAYGLRTACRVLCETWLDKSQSADVVFPALLLGGYAIEDYAKARLVEQGKDWLRHGHDLPWLVREAGVEVEESDQVLLRRLKEVVTWAGRYPAPLRHEDFVLGHGDEWPRGASDSDFVAIDRICELLADWSTAER